MQDAENRARETVQAATGADPSFEAPEAETMGQKRSRLQTLGVVASGDTTVQTTDIDKIQEKIIELEAEPSELLFGRGWSL